MEVSGANVDWFPAFFKILLSVVFSKRKKVIPVWSDKIVKQL